MRFCVCIKQVPDVNAPVHTGRMVLNAYDASAVEEALVLREAHGETVDLVLIGPAGATETIRKALAMGGDNAFHIVADESATFDSFAIATILHKFLASRDYDVIACGKQAQDTDSGLTGPMLARLLDVPYASNAVGLQVEGNRLVVRRQGDGGQEVLALEPPCLVTCSNDMNEPRIPNLRGIMAAKKKDIETIRVSDLVASVERRTEVLEIKDPPERTQGVILEGDAAEASAELARRLRDEAKVI